MTFAKPRNSGRPSGGSFYDAIPSNLFQVIHKPSNDDILKQLKQHTKYDKTAEWRMRSKYERGCNNEFDELRKQGILFGNHSSRKEYSTNNYLGSDRGKIAYYDYGPICGTSNVLDDKKNATIIREHCRRRGKLYGPQAITAVCGYPTTKSIICGRAPSPPLAKAPTYYDDRDDTFSIASSTKSSFRPTRYNTVAKSSRSTDSDRMCEDLAKLLSNTEPKSSVPLRNPQNQGVPGPSPNKVSVQHAKPNDQTTQKISVQHVKSNDQTNQKISIQNAKSSDQTNQKISVHQTNQKFPNLRNNVQGSHSDNISHKYDSSKVSARSEGPNKTANMKTMKSARKVTKFRLKNLKNLDKQLQKLDATTLLGGGDSGDPGADKTRKRERGKMRMPEKFKNQSSSVKKRLRRKPNVIKRKSLEVEVTNPQDDKRLRGPKIQGITSSSKIESIEIKNLEPTTPIKTIRTTVLPYPKAKYKPVMHD